VARAYHHDNAVIGWFDRFAGAVENFPDRGDGDRKPYQRLVKLMDILATHRLDAAIFGEQRCWPLEKKHASIGTPTLMVLPRPGNGIAEKSRK